MVDLFDVGGEEHAAKVVDRFLAATKTLVGRGDWVCEIDTEECRMGWPLAVDGVLTRARLDVSAYPLEQDYGFTITLNFPPCIMRLDYVPDYEGHTNPVEEYSRWPLIVLGPHIHLWEDNRRFCAASTLPRELLVAMPLANNIRRYEQAMHHFCDIARIQRSNDDLLPLPPRGRLI
jgi:hypothetical protein